MKLQTSDHGNQEGFVIVFVLMILVVVSILGLSSSRTSFMESKIVRNEQIYKDNFFDVDSGPYTIAKLVSRTIDEKSEQDTFAFGLYRKEGISNTDVFRQLMGLGSYTDKEWEVGVGDARIDISEGNREHAAGTATEFASGADGIGTGSKGGVEVNYRLSTTGKRADSTNPDEFTLDDQEKSVNIVGTYRKLPDIPGGL